MKDSAWKRPRIDMTLVQLYERGKVPSHIRVRDITLPLIRPIPGYITGFSGRPHFNLMYAGQYAEAQKKEMILVELEAHYEQSLYQGLLTLDAVQKYDVLNMLRVNKDLVAHIAAYWKHWIIEEEGTQAEDHYNWRRPADFIAQRPDFIPKLLQQNEFKHVKLFTYPVYTPFHDKPLTVTSFRADYPLITNARVSFHPDIEVTLD